MYWQSCLFGGTKAGMRDLLCRVEPLVKAGITYDEHALVVLWDAVDPVQLLTLPCRYAAPTTF